MFGIALARGPRNNGNHEKLLQLTFRMKIFQYEKLYCYAAADVDAGEAEPTSVSAGFNDSETL